MSHDRNHNFLSVPPSLQDHLEGQLDAAVVLVMYGDYQSSQSAEVYRLIKAIQPQLNVVLKENHLCIIFRHFPHRHIHPYAQRAAEAAEAAAAQGQFWQMHELLFKHQQDLGDGYLVEYASHLGLNIPQFLQDLFKGVHIARINQDIESGIQSGVIVAPVLFINGIRYTRSWHVEQLIAAITSYE